MTPTPSRPRRPTPTTFLCTNDPCMFFSLNPATARTRPRMNAACGLKPKSTFLASRVRVICLISALHSQAPLMYSFARQNNNSMYTKNSRNYDDTEETLKQQSALAVVRVAVSSIDHFRTSAISAHMLTSSLSMDSAPSSAKIQKKCSAHLRLRDPFPKVSGPRELEQ